MVLSTLLWTVAVMVMSHSAIANDDNDPLVAVVQQLTQRVEQLETTMTGYQTQLQELRKLEPSVAFSVQHSANQFTVASNSPILFDIVLLNKGGGYSARHGEFTAPVSGLYFLQFGGMSAANQGCWMQLHLNDRVISAMSLGDADFASSSSESLVVNLQQGDIVDAVVINAVGSDDVVLQGLHRTSFSGFLIQADWQRN